MKKGKEEIKKATRATIIGCTTLIVIFSIILVILAHLNKLNTEILTSISIGLLALFVTIYLNFRTDKKQIANIDDVNERIEKLMMEKSRYRFSDVINGVSQNIDRRLSLAQLISKYADVIIVTPGGPSIVANIAIEAVKKQTCVISVPLIDDINNSINSCMSDNFTDKKIDGKRYYLPRLEHLKDISNFKILLIEDITHGGAYLYDMRDILLEMGAKPENIYAYSFLTSETELRKFQNKFNNFSYYALTALVEVEFPWGLEVKDSSIIKGNTNC